VSARCLFASGSGLSAPPEQSQPVVAWAHRMRWSPERILMAAVLAIMTVGLSCLVVGGAWRIPLARTAGLVVVFIGFGVACLPLLAVTCLLLVERFRRRRR
jgi:hypothetical protein